MTFAVVTFGCRVNQADSLAIESALRARGAEPAPSDRADLVIVNSCSVTCSADQGTRQTIRRVARENPRARLIVTGCYATRSPDEVSALPGVVRVVTNARKDDLAAWLGEEAGARDLTTRERFSPDGDGPCGLAMAPGAGGRTAFTLRVQTGCDERCSYCIIPSTRGPSVSRPIERLLDDIARACDAGYREITLTGVHLGAYGRDLGPQRSLAELLERVGALRHDVLFRLGSLEPMDCTADVVRALSASPRFAHALHLPLQHASARVLRAMRRPYSVEDYARLIDRVRAALPDAALGSDVIVGFPGESDEDFEALRSYLERSGLTHLHVFPYSDRPGTEASRMPARAPGAVVRDRARAIRAIGRSLTEQFVRLQAGTIQRALVIDDGTRAVAGNGLKVRLARRRPRNDWVDIRISCLENGDLLEDGESELLGQR